MCTFFEQCGLLSEKTFAIEKLEMVMVVTTKASAIERDLHRSRLFTFAFPLNLMSRTTSFLVINTSTFNKVNNCHAHHGCQMAKFDPFLSLDCARVEGVGAQSKERKGSNFAA